MQQTDYYYFFIKKKYKAPGTECLSNQGSVTDSPYPEPYRK